MKPIKNVFEFDPRDLAEKYTDAKLTTQEVRGKQILRVHRVFLAALSSKLEGLFDEVQSVNDLIVVRNISFDALSTIINFIYTGKVTLSDRTPEFVEDFRDGLNMLKIGVSDKAEKRISEELKEMKQTTSRRRSPSQEDLNENQKRPRTRSVEKGPKSGKWEASISPREARPVPAMVREPRRRAGPEEETGFDLRGVIAGRQARAVEERSGQEGEEDRPFSKYCFDPKWPVANPDYPADRQVMVGPLPGHLDYLQLKSALEPVGAIHRLYLQFNHKYKSKPSHVRYAYAVFRDRAAASRLLAAGCLLLDGDYFAVTRMEESRHG